VAKVGLIGAGGVLLVIAVVGYIFPITDAGLSAIAVDLICSSGFGQIGQAFSGDAQQICSQYKIIALGIYGIGFLGIGLIIAGAVIPSKSNKEKDSSSLDILKDRYAKGEITQEKFDEMRKNLEK